MWNQAKFVWAHLGALRRLIIAGCVLMTQTNDILGWLPEGVRSKVSWLFPCWPWYSWLLIALTLIAAFSIEESYVRQHPTDTNTKKNGFPVVVLICIGIAWVVSLFVCHSRAMPPPAHPTIQDQSSAQEPDVKESSPTSHQPITKSPKSPKGAATKPPPATTPAVAPTPPVSISQGAGSAVSIGQQGGITAGTVNLDARPRISISDAQLSTISLAMKPFAGRKAFILLNGNSRDVADLGDKLEAVLHADNIECELHSGTALSEGGERSRALFVGYNERTSDMGKALVDVFYRQGILANTEISYHEYGPESQDTVQIILTPLD